MKPKELPNGLVRFVPDDTTLPFMSWRRYAFTLSAAASIISMVLFFSMEMNYGIDFRGGSSIEVQAKGDVADPGNVRARLGELNVGDVQVQEFGSPRDLLIRIEGQGGGDNAEQSVVEKVRLELEDDYSFRKVESVGPTVSSELAFYGTMGVLASLVAMLIYIWFRFEWQFGLGAVIATVHDVTMMVGLYVVSGLEFNLTSIAAILTIVGYSINDTVVVYDRVRENLRRYKKMPIEELLDLSMNRDIVPNGAYWRDDAARPDCTLSVWRRSYQVVHLCHDFRHPGRHLFVDLRCRAIADPVQAAPGGFRVRNHGCYSAFRAAVEVVTSWPVELWSARRIFPAGRR